MNNLEYKALNNSHNGLASGRASLRNLFETQAASFSGTDFQSYSGRGRSVGRTTNRHASPAKSQRDISMYREEIRHVFQEYDDLLQTIFKTFCSFTSGNESSKVKNMSLIKLFKDAGLVKV